MAELTKEQLIARVKQATAINRRRINANPDATGLVMDNELFAIALAALTAEPALYCLDDGDLEADAASTCKAVVDAWAAEWKEADPGAMEYKTTPLYHLPLLEGLK